MKKLLVLLAAGAAMSATPAFAVDLGIAIGSGSTGSTSGAASQSVGGSLTSGPGGITGQQSSGAAQSTGFGSLVFSNNDMLASSGQNSQTAQQGTSASLGFATSANANQTLAQGQSAAFGNIASGWIYVGP